MPTPPTTVITQGIDALRPAERNARTHSKSQIARIADSIRAFGFVNPVLIDGRNGIIAGHGRVAAAARLGLTQVPTLRVDHLTGPQIRAYMIADNRLAELAGWDKEILALEFGELVVIDSELDLSVTGFAHAEIDLLCGDVRDRQVVRRLMGAAQARMVFADPPYNVPIDGHVSGLGAHRHAEFACAAGEMSPDQFTTSLEVALGNLAACSRAGSLHYVCMDWRHLGELLAAGARVFTSQLNLCVWNKTNAGMGSFYRSKHELMAVFKQGRGPHVNNIALGRFGRSRSNVWDYAGTNTWRAGRSADLADHPTVKPVMLVADAIQDASHRGEIVLDGFGGSGTTLLAAERTGRHARLVEIDPRYVDVTIRRWQKLTGRKAVCAKTGVSFASRGASLASSTPVPEATKTRRRAS